LNISEEEYDKWQSIKIEYPILYKTFKSIHKKLRAPVSCEFSNTLSGFNNFKNDMKGEPPVNMIRPSIGRINHEMGYIPGNIFWQEFSKNASYQRKLVDYKIKSDF
jgi:hypothetical protein